jgi:hypothetical protein
MQQLTIQGGNCRHSEFPARCIHLPQMSVASAHSVQQTDLGAATAVDLRRLVCKISPHITNDTIQYDPEKSNPKDESTSVSAKPTLRSSCHK